MSLEKQVKDAMRKHQRDVLLAHLRENQHITVGELLGLRGEFGDALKSLTIAEIISGRIGGRGAGARGGRGANTRTKVSRTAYDDSMCAALQANGGIMSATELRAINGGTPEQARKSLNRLIEEGRITYTGRARGTRYSAS